MVFVQVAQGFAACGGLLVYGNGSVACKDIISFFNFACGQVFFFVQVSHILGDGCHVVAFGNTFYAAVAAAVGEKKFIGSLQHVAYFIERGISY